MLDKGKHIGAKSVTDDPYLVHCLQAGRLASNQEYSKEARTDSGKFRLNQDMIGLVTAKNAQALASDQDYKTRLHDYTVLPDDMKVQWAKKAYDLQSQVRGGGGGREGRRDGNRGGEGREEGKRGEGGKEQRWKRGGGREETEMRSKDEKRDVCTYITYVIINNIHVQLHF